MSIYIFLLGLVNGYFSYIYFKNEYKYLEEKFYIKVGLFTLIFTMITVIRFNYLVTIELFMITIVAITTCLLSILMIEDELNCEISLYLLLILGVLEIFSLVYTEFRFSFPTILFGNILFLLIYFLSKKMIGIGDLVLNGIFSFSFRNIINYFNFFTLVFVLASLFAIIGLLRKELKKKDQIPFIKFMAITYVFFI